MKAYEKEEFPEKMKHVLSLILFALTHVDYLEVDASGIITMTFSGYTAYKISSQDLRRCFYFHS